MKLWKVTLQIEALGLAETAEDAEALKRDIIDCEEITAYAEPYRGERPKGWDADTCVYHAGQGDITVARAIEIDSE